MTNLEQYARCVQTETWWGYFFCLGCEACPAQTYCHAQPSGTCCRENFMQWAGEETAKPPNDPLTLEELRGMDGEPVWVEFVGKPDGSLIPPLWMLVNVGMRQLVTDVEYVDWSDEGWTAYRRKPDGGQ